MLEFLKETEHGTRRSGQRFSKVLRQSEWFDNIGTAICGE